MKKPGIIIFLIIWAASSAFSQTRSYDIINFTPPSGWVKEDRPGSRIYSHVDMGRGFYALIALYPGVTSSGDPKKDFTQTWNALVKPGYGANIGPAPVAALPLEGYEGLKGTGYGMSDGKQTTVTLINYTGGGKTISIIINYSDSRYEEAIEKFVRSIRLKNPATK